MTVTNVYDPYKKKAVYLFFLGMAVIGMLDIPGLFFTNPYSHQTNPEAFYLAVIGAIVVGLMGLVAIWAYNYHKNDEVANLTGGAFILRARKKLRVQFHWIYGTIERIPDLLAKEVQAIVDKDLEELRQLAKIKELDEAKEQIIQDVAKLNWFYVPLPDGCPLPDLLIGSPAKDPKQLAMPMPGEIIYKGWIRKMQVEIFTLGVIAEHRFKYPGVDEIQIVPICVGAGTYFEYVSALEHAITPPQVDTSIVQGAKQLADARIIGVEAVQQLQVYRDAVSAHEQTRPVLMELATDIAGNILDLITLRNQPGNRQGEKKGHTGAIVGGTLLIGGLALGVWLLLHGGHL